jgi:hypothetical protein
MGREKGDTRGKEIRSDGSSSEEEESHASDEEYHIHVHAKRSKPQAPPARSQGCGCGQEGNLVLKKRTTSIGATTKRVSTSDVGDGYDADIDQSPYVQMAIPVHSPERTRHDPPLVNYMKSGTNVRPLCFQDPRVLQRSFFSDDRFWLAHQADWYESTILPKGRITTEMKWVD